jgi:hypothetical protein
MTTAGYAAWKTAFELSPIVLTGGVLSGFPGQMMPIMVLTEALNFPLGILSSGIDISLDNAFAHWITNPGSTLIDQELGRYPFANRSVAANATIQMPLMISMTMICPAKTTLGYEAKLAIMMSLQAILDAHNKAGGTYIVATPSSIYTNCVLRSVRDVSVAATHQQQNAYQFDFEKPLVTLDDVQAAENGLFGLISSGAQVPGGATATWSGLGTGAQVPASLAGIPLVPAQVPSVAGGSLAASQLAAGVIPV